MSGKSLKRSSSSTEEVEPKVIKTEQDEKLDSTVDEFTQTSTVDSLYEKIGKDYDRFLKLCQINSQYQLSESEAIEKLNEIPKDNFVIITLPFSNSLVWQFSSVFKTRSAYFPPPKDDFRDYKFDCLRNWCFHAGSRIGCMHRGCNILFNCFLRSEYENRFYLALYASLTRFIPKTTASSLFSTQQENIIYTGFVSEDDKQFILCFNKGLIYYAFDRYKKLFPNADANSSCGITAFKLLLQQGENRYELFNRRSTPYTSNMIHSRYPDNTFKFSLSIKGDVIISSSLKLCDEQRISMPILHRKFNYKSSILNLDFKIGLFRLCAFKDSIHLNRTSTEYFCTRLIISLGGYPLTDLYRSLDELTPISRDFYFVYEEGFPCNDLVKLYNAIFRPKTLLDVDFVFDLKKFQLRNELDSIDLVQMIDSAHNQPIEYKTVYPLVMHSDVVAFGTQAIVEDNYLLIKPTGNCLLRLPDILQTLIKHGIRIGGMVSRMITEHEFNILYPFCLQRVYGADWHCHMFSGECCIIKTVRGSFEHLRCAAWQIRAESKLPWVKNVIHSASNLEERAVMARLFEADFLTDQEIGELLFSIQ